MDPQSMINVVAESLNRSRLSGAYSCTQYNRRRNSPCVAVKVYGHGVGSLRLELASVWALG